jgi:SH3 domain protein
MLKTSLSTLILCFPLLLQAADQADKRAYITDQLEVPLRSGQSGQHKTFKFLSAGTPVTILDPKGGGHGFALVALETGEKGWVQTRHLSDQPAARSQLQALQDENRQLKDEIAAFKAGLNGSDKAAQQILAENERLNTELIAIRQASANALQIQAERDRLQETVIQIERELETTRRERNALDAESRQNWFLIGAGVLFGGILLGWALPKLTWRKKGGWDSF